MRGEEFGSLTRNVLRLTIVKNRQKTSPASLPSAMFSTTISSMSIHLSSTLWPAENMAKKASCYEADEHRFQRVVIGRADSWIRRW
jgi:hypothetical protein